ncbi:MAG: hypothetical protein V2I37_10905, partial [Marinilabiliaceae bacterium]|nr:hypothetical protein [Marinilabiliaceae bacterium]
MRQALILSLLIAATLHGCKSGNNEKEDPMKARLSQFEEVTLSTDISWLSGNEHKIISILIDVADIIDDIYWTQTYGDKQALLESIESEAARKYAM